MANMQLKKEVNSHNIVNKNTNTKHRAANTFEIVTHYADEDNAIPLEQIENEVTKWIQFILKKYHGILPSEKL